MTFWSDLWLFLRTEKKWWLLPFLLILGALAATAWLMNATLPSFIYPIF
jgi:uncharacterized protein DUF5989